MTEESCHSPHCQLSSDRRPGNERKRPSLFVCLFVFFLSVSIFKTTKRDKFPPRLTFTADLYEWDAHLVVEHLQLPVALLQLRQVGQELAAEVDVDQAGRAELGHPRLLWTQAAEGLAEGSEHREEPAESLTLCFHLVDRNPLGCKGCVCQYFTQYFL